MADGVNSMWNYYGVSFDYRDVNWDILDSHLGLGSPTTGSDDLITGKSTTGKSTTRNSTTRIWSTRRRTNRAAQQALDVGGAQQQQSSADKPEPAIATKMFLCNHAGCSFRADAKPAFLVHKSQMHHPFVVPQEGKYACSDCKQFSSLSVKECLQHIREKHYPYLFDFCQDCQITLVGKRLALHNELHQKENAEMYICGYCSTWSSSASNYQIAKTSFKNHVIDCHFPFNFNESLRLNSLRRCLRLGENKQQIGSTYFLYVSDSKMAYLLPSCVQHWESLTMNRGIEVPFQPARSRGGAIRELKGMGLL